MTDLVGSKLVGAAAAATVLLAPSALSAQSIPGIDSVKVKTIAIGPSGKAIAPSGRTPSTKAAAPPPADLPAPVRVRTLRITPDGHVSQNSPDHEMAPGR